MGSLERIEPQASISNDTDNINPVNVDVVAPTLTSPAETAIEVLSPIRSPSLPISYFFILISNSSSYSKLEMMLQSPDSIDWYRGESGVRVLVFGNATS